MFTAILLILIIAGGGAYLYSSKVEKTDVKPTSAPTATTTTNDPDVNKADRGSGTK